MCNGSNRKSLVFAVNVMRITALSLLTLITNEKKVLGMPLLRNDTVNVCWESKLVIYILILRKHRMKSVGIPIDMFGF